jgi:hypothetical protein
MGYKANSKNLIFTRRTSLAGILLLIVFLITTALPSLAQAQVVIELPDSHIATKQHGKRTLACGYLNNSDWISIRIRSKDGKALVIPARLRAINRLLNKSSTPEHQKQKLRRARTNLRNLNRLTRQNLCLQLSPPDLVPDNNPPPALLPPSNPDPPPGGAYFEVPISSYYLLLGLEIFASDGRFLGVISSSQYLSSSICNKFGSYGSSYGISSIYNRFGLYGGRFALRSPFNEFSFSAPVIFYGNTPVAYLTTNPFLGGPWVDTRLLTFWLACGQSVP